MKLPKLLFVNLLLFFIVTFSFAQIIDINKGKNITPEDGDFFSGQWSHDGKSLLFNAVTKNKNSLAIHNLADDTTYYYTNSNYVFNNPVWHPDGNKVVFDSDKDGSNYLYIIDLTTNEISPLFKRNISCRNASFSKSARQVYFSGYDKIAGCWKIYSYDFVYDNLNELTSYTLGCVNPQVSDDGSMIAYGKMDPFKNIVFLDVINWYGDEIAGLPNLEGVDETWSASGLKLYFISYKDNINGDLYSIWKDGSHPERYTTSEYKLKNPAISPDGLQLAVSVLTEHGWKIFIVSIDDY